jgi:hypothetical protein
MHGTVIDGLTSDDVHRLGANTVSIAQDMASARRVGNDD